MATEGGSRFFFQLMSRRYEHASTILTRNKGFGEWGVLFGDDVMATALIDRGRHYCHIVNILGNSYRMGAAPRALPPPGNRPHPRTDIPPPPGAAGGLMPTARPRPSVQFQPIKARDVNLC